MTTKHKPKRQPSVEVQHVSMMFNLSQEMTDSLKDYFIGLFTGKNMQKDEFWALEDVSFKLYPGDRLGILGLNGAGKSTLLKALAGVYHPTKGKVIRRGNIAPLLELGAGFDRQYTARENIYLYGAILGYKKDYLDSVFDDIISFAELEKFVDVPIKNFSSGMKSRLGFAICTTISPDILILDEVLSVGDARFRKKSEARLLSLFNEDTTVLFVSHNLQQVKRLCNKALILDHGKMVAFGDIEEIAPIYQEMVRNDGVSVRQLAKRRKKKRKIKRLGRYRDGYLIMKKQGLTMDETLDLLDVKGAKVRAVYRKGIERIAARAAKKAAGQEAEGQGAAKKAAGQTAVKKAAGQDAAQAAQ